MQTVALLFFFPPFEHRHVQSITDEGEGGATGTAVQAPERRDRHALPLQRFLVFRM